MNNSSNSVNKTLANSQSMTDAELYNLCREYGQAALEARRKFLGLLPEVHRRELWRTKGYGSIREFAAKLAGVSEDQLNEVLHLHRKLHDKPALQAQLISGQVSHNKIARVVAIATPENQSFWAAQTASLSKTALNTLVKDQKTLPNTLSGQSILPEISSNATIALKAKTVERLNQLKSKGFDLDQLLNQLLDQRESEIAEEKAKLGEEQEYRAQIYQEFAKRVIGPVPKPKRAVPIKIRRVLQQEHGTKCCIATCQKPAKTIHHAIRFSLNGNHDPRYLQPLCPAHHEITHKIDLKYQQHSNLLK